MKNRDVKNLIKSECENLKISPISSNITCVSIQERPPTYSRTSVSGLPTLKYAIISLCILVLFSFATMPNFFSSTLQQSNITSYILEINPSICITADSADSVIAICSLNSDGDVLLSDERFETVLGQTLESGIGSIVDASVELGYLEDYEDRIVLFAVNNKESFAFEKTRAFEGYLSKRLKAHNLNNISIDKGCMSIDDFKTRMNFDSNYDDLDKMREIIKSRARYYSKSSIPNFPPNYY